MDRDSKFGENYGLGVRMEPRWAEVNRVFAEALDQPVNRRAEYLRRSVPDLEIRTRVEELLRAWESSEGFLERDGEAWTLDGWGIASGTRIGAWRVEERVGSGGMGNVYRVERDDGQFKQAGALKVIAVGLSSESREQQFLEERQILATLEHPNIARLIDGGVTADGMPYLVMEFVEGDPMDRWRRERDLSMRVTLELVRTVCQAVQFAHRNLVVHCDLKPANILVMADGTVKLLDFGIAKLLQREAEATATLLRPLTPDYASPEQVRGAPITTASDIYSLGILLHEVITGRRPYTLTGKTLDEILAIVCDRELDPPKTGEADLDAIILKALRRDPSERYASAAELAEDIGRFLRSEPVMARPPGATYVAKKFIARHRIAAAATSFVLLIAAVSGGLLFRESRIATKRFNDVRALSRFVVFDMDDMLKPLPGSTKARKAVVEQALRYLDSLANEAAGDTGLERELGLAYTRLAAVSGNPQVANLGDGAQSLRLYQKAAAMLEGVARRSPSDIQASKDLAEAYAGMLDVTGDRRLDRLALDTSDKLVALRRQIASREAAPQNRGNLAHALLRRARAKMIAISHGSSIADYDAAIAIYEDLLAKEPSNPAWIRSAALGHKYLGAMLYDDAKQDGATLAHFRRATELDELGAARTGTREAKLDLSFDYSQEAEFQFTRRGDAEAGRLLFEKALALRNEVVAGDPNDMRPRSAMVYAEYKLTKVLLKLGRAREAEAHAARAVQFAREVEAAGDSAHNRSYLGLALSTAGEVRSAMADASGACKLRLEARKWLDADVRGGNAPAWEKEEFSYVQRSLAGCGAR